jgi:hypothetical protein
MREQGLSEEETGNWEMATLRKEAIKGKKP